MDRPGRGRYSVVLEVAESEQGRTAVVELDKAVG